MLDNIKLSCDQQDIIQRLVNTQGFERYLHRNNNYAGLCKHGKKIRLDFRKVFENGNLVGFHHVEISISPHYHFNNYLHNGNDFTPKNCTKAIFDILTDLGIEPQEYDLLKVCNLEFGLNIIPKIDIKNLIDGLMFYSTQHFRVSSPNLLYSKTTKKDDVPKEKHIKAYAKGLHFADYPQYGIDGDAFRFEVKHKKARPINTILKKTKVTVLDLLNVENYKLFSQEIIKEWDLVLLLNQNPDFSNLNKDEVEFIQSANKKEFWNDLSSVQFSRKKEKYYKILQRKNNWHTQIKVMIIDKLSLFLNDTFSPQKTLMNREKFINEEIPLKQIKCENVSHHQNNTACLLTHLDISMQKKGSRFLSITGLKWYLNNEPKTYKKIEQKYLTSKMKTRSIEEQIYSMAHNIRNEYTNVKHNPINSRQRFESRNYNSNQLQMFSN